MPVHQVPTFKDAILVEKSVENMIKGRDADKVEVGEKRKTKGFPENKNNSKRRSSPI